MRTTGLKARFERHFIPEPNSGCWLWTAWVNRQGYGRLRLRRGETGTRAHRLAWEIYRGTIPPERLVLHRCDTPGCVNPDHLFLGDRRANAQDRDAKGRQRSGTTKLTAEDVRAIRSDVRPLKIIATDYGVSQSAVSQVKLRQSWGSVA